MTRRRNITVVALAAAAGALAGCGGGGGESSADKTAKAAEKLDSALVSSVRRAQRQISSGNSCITFKQSTGAFGISDISSCARKCTVCGAKVDRETSRVQRAWRAAPAAVRTRYRRAYSSALAFLRSGETFMKASATFARSGGYGDPARANRFMRTTSRKSTQVTRALKIARARIDRYVETL